MPEKEYPPYILRIHVGRRLLGLTDESDRKKYLRPRVPPPSEKIIEAYDRKLRLLDAGDRKALRLFDNGWLERWYSPYVDARVRRGGETRPAAVIAVYERLLKSALAAPSERRIRPLDTLSSPLPEHFVEYVDALIATGRSKDVLAAVETFRQHWDHNLGYGMLAQASQKAGDEAAALRYFEKAFSGGKTFPFTDDADRYAEILVRKGRAKEARSLLERLLRDLVKETRESEYASDRRQHEVHFQQRRAAYLRIFPRDGAQALAKAGIPETTRKRASSRKPGSN
jgi:hypothetical protein